MNDLLDRMNDLLEAARRQGIAEALQALNDYRDRVGDAEQDYLDGLGDAITTIEQM